jgi:CubicO group peptidase (beta-lactamase class C family)
MATQGAMSKVVGQRLLRLEPLSLALVCPIGMFSWEDKMGSRARLSFFLTCACLFASIEVHAQEAQQVDAIFADREAAEKPGCAVVIVRDGSIAYENGYGMADLEHHIKITPQTVFDVASVAKQFTGLGVAMLIEQGKLKTEQDIRSILPSVPDFGRTITIDNLLHHTSGLRDWPETLVLSGVDWASPITLDLILQMVEHQRELDFLPGEEFQYSNTGYSLLAAAVAQVTGQPFPQWMSENIFAPLGMAHTFVADKPDAIVLDRAESYAPKGKSAYIRVVSQTAAQGSSSVFTTADDMGKWLANLDSGRVGGRSAIQMTWQGSRLRSGNEVKYGFGWELGAYYGIPGVEHSGSWAGYVSDVAVVPEKHFEAAVLCNAPDVSPHGIAIKLASIYMPDVSKRAPTAAAVKPSNAYKPNPKSWDKYLGTYRLGPGWLLTISREKETLKAQASHEEKYEMKQTGENKFFVEAYHSAVEFNVDPSGKVPSLLYHGKVSPRIDTQVLSPGRLARFTGDYWSEELRQDQRVTLDAGRLAMPFRIGTVHLIPIGHNQFDADEGRFTVQFTEGQDGAISELKLSMGRVRNLRYTKTKLPVEP